MIDLKAYRIRARDWALPDGVIRNDVDNLCDEVERLSERLAQAEALLRRFGKCDDQGLIDAYFDEHAPKEQP